MTTPTPEPVVVPDDPSDDYTPPGYTPPVDHPDDDWHVDFVHAEHEGVPDE